MRTLAVDFDGVIHAYRNGWQDGTIYDEPVPGAFDGLRTLMTAAAVFIHSSRPPAQVAGWLTTRGGFACVTEETAGRAQFWNVQGTLLVTDRKLPAAAYLDDRAVRFVTWEMALAELEGIIK